MKKRRVVSLWLPTFATDRLDRRLSAEKKQAGSRSEYPALATVTAAHGGMRIAAASPAAQAGGVMPGLPLADARALLPGLRTVEADPQMDLRALDSLAGWCGRYTPWVSVDTDAGGAGAGAVWLDITGCARLFGGEEALLKDLVVRLRRLGFTARAAIADTPGTAWAVARFGGFGDSNISVVPPRRLRRILAPLPVAGLRLDGATIEGLSRVGLRRIGDLLDQPRAPLAARFGEAVMKRLDQALGKRGETLSPRMPVPLLMVRRAFAEPISRVEDIVGTIRHLLDDLCRQLGKSQQGARRLALALYRTDGTHTAVHIGTSRAVRDANHLERLFREKIEKIDPGFGIEVMVLSVPAADVLEAVQTGLEPDQVCRTEGLARLVDRVGNRLGANRISRFAAQASHIPEKASREIPALVPTPLISSEALESGEFRPARPRPIHLLPWPEPIEVIAPVPDHPPVMFRWRRRQHRVMRSDGPERIGPEWWLREQSLDPASNDAATRDYYRVEDAEGQRFWLYREGLYLSGLSPRWYMHGMFA
ncbi:MAG: DNA polymerase Y family protein [Rhodospirillales bacterium]|nr:DNA polymerase Y family protein [Rhodospirillales bacterium]